MTTNNTSLATATTANNLPVKLSTMADAIQLAQQFAQAHVMGANNPAEGMLAVVLINEIGLVKAESNYHIMMGRISKKAHAVLVDFVRAGGTYKILKRDEFCASMYAKKDESEGVYTFTWEDAQQEPFVYQGGSKEQQRQLTLPPEQRTIKAKYATPRSRMQMLWARLISDTCQALCPEANDGMYPPEVVSDFDDVASDKAGAVIDVTEAQERVDAETVKPDSVVVDYTLCPIKNIGGECAPWKSFNEKALNKALASDKPEITATHKAAIRLVIESRKEA